MNTPKKPTRANQPATAEEAHINTPATRWILRDQQRHTYFNSLHATPEEADRARTDICGAGFEPWASNPERLIIDRVTIHGEPHIQADGPHNFNPPQAPDEEDDWRAQGEQDFDLSIITGQTSDDDPEQWSAREEREDIRNQLTRLTANQLRDYIDGLHTGMEIFFFRGI